MIKLTQKCWAAVLALLFPVLAIGQDTLPLPVLLDAVYSETPALHVARTGLTTLSEDRASQRARKLPNLAFSISGTSVTNTLTTPPDASPDASTTATTTTPIGATLSFSQSLYTGGINTLLVQRVDFAIDAGAYRLTQTESDVLYQTLAAWQAWQQATDAVSVAEKNVARLEKHYERTQALIEFGRARNTELLVAEASLEGGKASLLFMRNAVLTAENNIAELYGQQPPQPDAESAAPLLMKIVDLIPATLEQAQEIASNAPSIRAAQSDLEQAKTANGIASGVLRPQLTLNGSYTTSTNNSGKGSAENNSQIGVSMAYNFFRGGEVWSEYRKSLQQIKQAEQNIRLQSRTVAANVRSAWLGLNNAYANNDALRKSLELAVASRDAINEEVEVGRSTLLELLDAEQQIFDSEQQWQDAQYAIASAQIQLIYAIGLITPELLDLTAYNPKLYSEQIRVLGLGASKQFSPQPTPR